ncbi:MAG: rRNA maturation RNase YbeY [Desulfovibrionaceae bacterium]|nr:rRNA maturation RNase YbeY [Desulfovibrionaceae bacterium]
MYQIRFTCPAGARLPFHPREIRRLVLCMLQKLIPQSADVELVFVRDVEIAALNRRYLRRQGPTNCLAFPDAGRQDAFFRGSLFVSLDTLYRECLLYGQAPAAHLRRLLAHGLAHLAGFDHGEEMEALCARLEECREQSD